MTNCISSNLVNDGIEDATEYLEDKFDRREFACIPAGKYRVTRQLVVPDQIYVKMDKRTQICRDWGGIVGYKYQNATIRNEGALTGPQLLQNPHVDLDSLPKDADICIEGGVLTSTGAHVGAGYYLTNTKNLNLIDTTVDRSYSDWAYAIGGEDFCLDGVSVLNNQEIFEDGVHIMHGNGVVIAKRIVSGDDAFAVGTNYDLPITDVDFHMANFKSWKGHAVRVFQNRVGLTGTYPAPVMPIENITFRDGKGMAGVRRNGYVRIDDGSNGTVSDIELRNITIDGGLDTHDGVNQIGARFRDVNGLCLSNVRIKNALVYGFDFENVTNGVIEKLSATNRAGVGGAFLPIRNINSTLFYHSKSAVPPGSGLIP